MSVKKPDYYHKKFSKLRLDRVPNRWQANTNHCAPYKPFLLLAMMDLIAQAQITTNVIELNADLIDAFDLYWIKVMGKDKQRNPVLPFYHLKSDGFWHLHALSGMEQALATSSKIHTYKQFYSVIKGATLDEELYTLVQDAQERDKLRQILIETYFSPETRPILVEVGTITAQSFEYSRELVHRSRGTFTLQEAPELDQRYMAESRTAGFRQVIVKTYHQTCAVCKIRIVTPEGFTAVEAAHIVPWNISHNDDPRNGLALCGFHHWAFDKGLIGITPDYNILISPVVPTNDPATRALRALHEHKMLLPDDELLYPHEKALKWHYAKKYREEVPSHLL
ncbi:MAG: HNH endonuclease [Chloroflexaceae bacterium]|nr:HNH endonuclease [Chloroflexaceae bacterium]